MYKSTITFLTVLFFAGSNGVAEDIIWRNIIGSPNSISDKVVGRTPGPGMNDGLRTYALANVLISPDQCDENQPGMVRQIKTYFVDDIGPNGLPANGIARLNVFQIPPGVPLPDNIDDDPDFGIDVPVTFTQVDLNGVNAVEVRVDDLDAILNPPLQIDVGTEYYIGLTPVFEDGNEPFGGNHIAGTMAPNNEKPSAERMTSPQQEPWEFAVDAAGNSLFALIEIRGIVDDLPNPPAPDVFLSFSDFGEPGAAGNTTINAGIGSTFKAFVWVDGGVEIDTQASLKLETNNFGVVDITRGESFETEIFLNDVPIGVRWGDVFGPGQVSPDNQSLELIAVAGSQGTGIISENSGPQFFDQLYDPVNDAFLFGCVEFRVSNLGTTDITLTEGKFGIVHDGIKINPSFGSLTVSGDASIGDINLDGAINLLDVFPFVDLLATGGYLDVADTNRDGCVNLLDVNSFIEILSFGGP